MEKVILRKIDGGEPAEDVFLPSLRFTEDHLPEIKKWMIGGKYILIIEAEMTSLGKVDERVDAEGGSKLEAQFNVKSVGVEDDFEKEYARRFFKNGEEE